MKKTFIISLLFTFPALAQTPTIVYGAATTANGATDSYTVSQPADAPNPLGNPIVIAPQTQYETPSLQTQPIAEKPQPDIINQSAPQNPAPFSESPKQENSQIQNTLYQGGNRIYDVQSFPLSDVKTVTEPNIQPTISTYPEY